MPRLLGVDIPNERPTSIALTYLYGVGPKTSRELCHKAGVNANKRARELAEDEIGRLAALLERDYMVDDFNDDTPNPCGDPPTANPESGPRPPIPSPRSKPKSLVAALAVTTSSARSPSKSP